MTTVFLSGSRRLSCLSDSIRSRLDNMVTSDLSIIVGDANGADKAMQGYLAENSYRNVTVFCAGEHCRNNVGNWPTQNVVVDSKLSGREFYAQKDKEMARLADFGFVLWDGKSSGSIANILELLKFEKKAVVYFGPEKQFCNVNRLEAINALLDKCDAKAFDVISKKLRLAKSLREMQDNKQATLTFF